MQHVLLHFLWVSIQYLMTLNTFAQSTFQARGNVFLSYQLDSRPTHYLLQMLNFSRRVEHWSSLETFSSWI